MNIFRLFIFISITQAILPYPIKMIINQPVVDLRTAPIATNENLKLPTFDITNPLQETQLLLCERIIAHHDYIDFYGQQWLFVSALAQLSYKGIATWHAYPGWIKKEQATAVNTFSGYTIVVKKQHANLCDQNNIPLLEISIGTKLSATKINETTWKTILPDGKTAYIADQDVYTLTKTIQENSLELRANIINTALTFLGSWYSWGGRSAQHENYISSVDCSALVNLSFAAHGLQIPRMSHEQFLVSKQLQSCQQLQLGDFIYFVSLTRESYRMDHVMIYIGDDKILEATSAGDQKVRIISFQDRFGQNCNNLTSGDLILWNDYECYLYFGSLLDDHLMIQHWRDEMLNVE